MPPHPVRADGALHLLYEIHLTNFKSTAVEISSLTIAGDGRQLATYAGAELGARMKRIGAPADADPRTLPPGTRAVVFVELVLQDVPTRLTHRLTAGGVTFDDEGIAPLRAAPIAIQPPLDGDRWVAMNGLSNTSSHRRTVVVVNGKARIAQRFATDWTRLGSDGQAFHGDPANNANWYAYGADVRAVADGTVADTHDGIPENDPTADKMAVPITLETVGGNYVIIDLGGGRYAFYAHLQPHSLRVHAGERVQAGEVIAKLGNSGNSDAPHLHFHIGDRPSPLGAEGVPYVLRRFDILGRVPSLAVLENGQGWQPHDSPVQRHDEIPAENVVVRFPK